MSNFTRKDLQYNYHWTAAAEHDNAKIIGFPDSYLLDRDEGYEVLPYINRYMTNKGYILLATFQKIETLIAKDLPGNIRGHKTIKEWLDGKKF